MPIINDTGYGLAWSSTIKVESGPMVFKLSSQKLDTVQKHSADRFSGERLHST